MSDIEQLTKGDERIAFEPLLAHVADIVELDRMDELGQPMFAGHIKRLQLAPALAAVAGLGPEGNCDVSGGYENGISFMLRPPGRFKRASFGLLARPVRDPRSNLNMTEVWAGPLNKTGFIAGKTGQAPHAVVSALMDTISARNLRA